MIVNRLPFVLKEQGLSIRELSRRTGITYTTIRAVYHSDRRSVQIEVIDSLCREMGIQPGDIYTYYPNESEAQAAVVEITSANLRQTNSPVAGGKNGRSHSRRIAERDDNWHVW